MRIVTAEEMRQIDREAAARGLPTAFLMANAGRAVAEAMRDRYGDLAGKDVLILVGPGNNGGDGLVAANHLRDWGAGVTLYIWNRAAEGDANFQAARERGISFVSAAEDEGLARLRDQAGRARIVVDALLGTGKARPIEGLLKQVLETIAQTRAVDTTVVAVDLPTGLDADTGALDAVTLPADLTVTLGYPKPGLFLLPGAAHVGKLAVADIGLPPEVEGQSSLEMITPALVKMHLPARPAISHKGTFGKVLVVAGSYNYIGAPFLACVGAGRVGAGLVTLACANQIYPILASKLVETTFLPLPDVVPGLLGSEAAGVLARFVAGYNVILLGPGIGHTPGTVSFVERLLRQAKSRRAKDFVGIPWLIDADGLNALAQIKRWPDLTPPQAVFTPHPTELARLLCAGVDQVQADRLGAARRGAQQSRQVVVLKGANTIVAAPDGQAFINPSANPALATAGTGDVLAGAIAGFMAQGLEPKWAAVAGVFIHSLAGEILREEIGEAGVLAGDLLDILPEAINMVKR
ncbi:MAG: NAD(P)H-hydrate dehydratase [Chloroflexi bacterium]|nr:NAD(P)H-hydrate dehydratase [Chloroflexota bacterium]